jgi:undecaprenyl-diphosphatase
MQAVKYILLGVVQGLTEFLPVSSSGHLVISQRLLNLPVNVAYEVILHLATLVAVVFYFRKELKNIIFEFFIGLFSLFRGSGIQEVLDRFEYFKLALLLLAGTFATAIIGISFKDYFEQMHQSLLAVAVFLIITGVLILFADKVKKGGKEIKGMAFLDAIIIGIFQGAAIAPGLSRSGTTISGSLFRGLKREFAATFSFLLAIPAILGAGIIEAKEIIDFSLNTGLPVIIMGASAAFISGYFAIAVFMRMIKRGIAPFAYYCFLVGGLVLFTAIFR